MTLHRLCAPFAHLEYFPVLKSWRTGLTTYLTSKTAPHHDPIERPQLQRDLHRAFFHPNQTTHICPLCLQEEVAYDRLYAESPLSPHLPQAPTLAFAALSTLLQAHSLSTA